MILYSGVYSKGYSKSRKENDKIHKKVYSSLFLKTKGQRLFWTIQCVCLKESCKVANHELSMR